MADKLTFVDIIEPNDEPPAVKPQVAVLKSMHPAWLLMLIVM